MNNLMLVRHAQSKYNLERRFTGFYDVGLTPKGEDEAEFAGQLIKNLNIEFDAYFTSQLTRAYNSLDIILKVLNKSNVEINRAWELNERHYGGLTGLNKDETIKKYGDEQVKIIKTELLNERHYGGLTGLNKDETIKKYGEKQVKIWRRSFDIPPPKMEDFHPYKNQIESDILSESLKDTFERVIPYFEKNIKPLLLSKKNILVVFHGNSCRALLMKIFNISEKKITEFEIPTGNPLLIRFENNFKIIDYKYLDQNRAQKIIFNI